MKTVTQALELLEEFAGDNDNLPWMKPRDVAQVLEAFKCLLASSDPNQHIHLFAHSVVAEYHRAIGLFPGDNLNCMALSEEYGELVKAVMDEPEAAVYKEAVQTAAMCARVAIQGDAALIAWRDSKGLDSLGRASKPREPSNSHG